MTFFQSSQKFIFSLYHLISLSLLISLLISLSLSIPKYFLIKIDYFSLEAHSSANSYEGIFGGGPFRCRNYKTGKSLVLFGPSNKMFTITTIKHHHNARKRYTEIISDILGIILIFF